MREELTNEELIQLYDVVTSSVNSQFELWITITFAVIIASYIAGHRLAKSLQYLAVFDACWSSTIRRPIRCCYCRKIDTRGPFCSDSRITYFSVGARNNRDHRFHIQWTQGRCKRARLT